MAAPVVRGFNSNSGSATITVGASPISVGDLIVLAASDNASPSLAPPNGFTQVKQLTGQASDGTFNTALCVCWKVADANDVTKPVYTWQNFTQPAYGESIAVVVSGQDAVPITGSQITLKAAATSSIDTGAAVSKAGDLLLAFFTQIRNDPATPLPSFTDPADSTRLAAQGASSGYNYMTAVSKTATGTSEAMTSVTNAPGTAMACIVSITPPVPEVPGATAIRATAVNTANPTTQSVVIPSAVKAGDLLLLFCASYSASPTGPSGWSQETIAQGGSTYSDYGILYSKIAVAADAGSTVTWGGGSAPYVGTVLVAVKNPDPSGALRAKDGRSNNGTTDFLSNNVTTVKSDIVLMFVSEMSNSGTTPTITYAPGSTDLATNNSSAGYHVAKVASMLATGGTQSFGASTSTPGGGTFLTAVVKAWAPPTGSDSVGILLG